MGVVVRFAAPRVAELVEEPEPELQADEVRIATLYSGISAGTELSVYRGTNPYLDKRWDPDRRMFVEGARSIAYPQPTRGSASSTPQRTLSSECFPRSARSP
jgi:hypothetical protein